MRAVASTIEPVQLGCEGDWDEIEYTYDPSGRRIEKNVDGTVTKYLAACPELAERDGSHCIAEYDANDTLVQKYIYGPGVDQPICMIDVADSNAVYYYHFDALGSVVALSDGDGDTVQVYEYDVYGQVAASDPNHPNPFLFTGRRYDTETGLYYYRARYYNPTIGRFLQTDPIGYGDGMNMYAYCGNNSITCIDPSGLASVAIYDGGDKTDFESRVQHADYSIDMRVPGDVWDVWEQWGLTAGEIRIKWLKDRLLGLRRADVDITELYFYDHGWNGEALFEPEGERSYWERVDEGGLTIGDEWFTVKGPEGYYPEDYYLEDFADMLRTMLKADDPDTEDYDGTTVHLRSCYGGLIADEMAEWSGLEVTGYTDLIYNTPPPPHLAHGPALYYSDGDYVVMRPGEVVLQDKGSEHWGEW